MDTLHVVSTKLGSAILSLVLLVAPTAVLLLGLVMLVSPPMFARFNAFLARRQRTAAGIRWNNPEEVRRSLGMQLECRIVGLIVVLLGLSLLYNQFIRQ